MYTFDIISSNIKALNPMIMNKILVTTDFSSNSKAGLRFAIQMASQHNYSLTFFHSYHLLRPTKWNDKVYESFEKIESAKIKRKLCTFVDSVYKSMDITPTDIEYAIKNSFVTDSNIMQFAAQNRFSFICISRRGNAKHKKIFGTNTSNLIDQSKVPVIAVPPTYRRKPISKVLYASDLSAIEKEVKKVADFAKPLKAKIELLHFKAPSDILEDPKCVQKAVKKFSDLDIKLGFDDFDFAQTLIVNLQKAIKKSKPSIVIMFTEQNRSFFQKLFLSSNSVEYSFQATIPLLVFPKV